MNIFFPILISNELYDTSTIVYNYPPNDIDLVPIKSRYLSIIWMGNDCWHTKLISKLNPYESKEISQKSLQATIRNNHLLILSLTDEPLVEKMNELPNKTIPETTPAWRSTICVHRGKSTASYQGEIISFPKKASLLSFSPFLQNKSGVKNYLIFLNLESKPISRKSFIRFTTANKPESILKEVVVRSNKCNLIDLTDIKIEQDKILVCYSQDISGIPLFLSYSDEDNSISLEHTHPPSSFTVYGERNYSQRLIKKNWFNLLQK